MIIKNIDLSTLSRDEYISFIACIIECFKLDYGPFTDKEKQLISYFIRSIICKRSEKI